MKKTTRIFLNSFKGYVLLICAIFLEGFGLKSFLIPIGVIEGGVTGSSLLISFITPLSVSLLLFFLNLPFIFLGKKQVGKSFAIKTFIAIVGISFVLFFVDFPVITSDKLLATIFGGFIVGAATGLAIRGGSVIDGLEVLSVYLSKKTGFSIGEIVLGVNIVIFSFAALFLSVERALYSILTYLVASKTIDFVVQGVEEYIGLTIISKKSSEIREKLVKDLGKGLTVYKGKSGYYYEKDYEIEILFTFVTRLEVVKIKDQILAVDPGAVIIEQGIHEIYGGVVKKRPLH